MGISVGEKTKSMEDTNLLEKQDKEVMPSEEIQILELEEFFVQLKQEYATEDPVWGTTKYFVSQRFQRDRKGNGYFYQLPLVSFVSSLILIIFGSLATGVISVGIGETTITSLRRIRVPAAVATATSVTVTFIVVLFGVGTSLIIQLATSNSQIPWDVIIWTVPGVLIGGQIGPFVGKIFKSEKKDYIL